MADLSDGPALRELAERDSSHLPGGALLVAEQDGVVLAAWSALEARAIADPFHPTIHLVEMLRTHAERSGTRLAGLSHHPAALRAPHTASG